LAMREKSAGEPIIILSALYSALEKDNKYLFEQLKEIYSGNNIEKIFDVRIDQRYYNENEPDVHKLLKSKELGLIQKEANERYFSGLSLAYKTGQLTLGQLQEILSQDIPDLDWSGVVSIDFVGDGTYITLQDICVEVRPSGTDAINKSYAMGLNKDLCRKYAVRLSSYPGERGEKYRNYVKGRCFNDPLSLARKTHTDYHEKGYKHLEYDPGGCSVKMI